MTPAQFRALVWRFYKEHGRHDLPWRKRHTVYRVLVSELMLQQTQVDRVIPFYTRFMKQFPSAKALAAAPLSEVLKAWQGLGYNRRAKMLHQAAKIIAFTRFNLVKGATRLNLVEELENLPGVGPYTARAVAAFAFNTDTPVIETNIRTVIIHHFFADKTNIADSDIEPILERVLPKGKSREWYSALMDYGAHLKRSGISHNVKSKTYAKQSKFTGSLREARGAILRKLTEGQATEGELVRLLGPDRRAQIKTALAALVKEKMVVKRVRSYALAS